MVFCYDLFNSNANVCKKETYTVDPILVTEENVDSYLEKAGLSN